jgi:hypothetical protein
LLQPLRTCRLQLYQPQGWPSHLQCAILHHTAELAAGNTGLLLLLV